MNDPYTQNFASFLDAFDAGVTPPADGSFLPFPRVIPAWIPRDVAHLVDMQDPDILYVIKAVQGLRYAGLDVTQPDVFEMAVDIGHKRAAEVDDDTELQPERERNLEQEAALEAALRGSPTYGLRHVDERVYYMRMGNRCKIGYTTNLRSRVATINPEELLGWEPGSRKLEQERHKQFADLRTHGEWFRYEGPLVEHVEQLRASRRAA